MVIDMNRKTKEQIKDFLDKIIEKSNILNYKYINIDGDDDINFLVTPKLDTKKIKEDIQLRLLIYCADGEYLSIYCPLMYKLKDNDSLMFALNAINKVNGRIAVGKIYLNNENSVISYINRILFNDICSELTSDLLNDYIDAFLLSSIEFYTQMKEVVVDENKQQ